MLIGLILLYYGKFCRIFCAFFEHFAHIFLHILRVGKFDFVLCTQAYIPTYTHKTLITLGSPNHFKMYKFISHLVDKCSLHLTNKNYFFPIFFICLRYRIISEINKISLNFEILSAFCPMSI